MTCSRSTVSVHVPYCHHLAWICKHRKPCNKLRFRILMFVILQFYRHTVGCGRWMKLCIMSFIQHFTRGRFGRLQFKVPVFELLVVPIVSQIVKKLIFYVDWLWLVSPFNSQHSLIWVVIPFERGASCSSWDGWGYISRGDSITCKFHGGEVFSYLRANIIIILNKIYTQKRL